MLLLGRAPALPEAVATVTAQPRDAAGWAARYATGRLPVFPVHWITEPGRCSCRRTDCHSPGKHPLTEHGMESATTDLDQIGAWWERWPAANVAIRPPSGVIVLDVDPRHRGATALLELTRQHTPLPATLTAWTGSGGLHVWLSYSGRYRGALCRGVDVKGHNGYLVAPPSLHLSGRRYEWGNELPTAPAPRWVRRLLDPPPPTPVRPQRVMAARSRSGGADEGLVRLVANAKAGERNKTLHWAACRACERGASAQLLDDLVAAAVSAGLDEPAARRTVASAGRTVTGASR